MYEAILFENYTGTCKQILLFIKVEDSEVTQV